MKLRSVVAVAAVLTFFWAPPAAAKPRPTVDSPNGDTCFLDPTTDKNCPSNGEVGAICYCCYDDGCWICGVTPTPGDACEWDGRYRAKLPAPPTAGPMSIGPGSGARATQDALIDLLTKKNVVTRKELVDEVMNSRELRGDRALENGKLEGSVAEQKRINRYFHDVVLPKLKPCWERVQGRGTIEFQYRYEKDAKRGWAFKTLQGGRSTLPKGQDAAASSCMQKAVAATSLPMEGGDAGASSYTINWQWPVPLPPDAPQRAEAMFRGVGGSGATGEGGCDGNGAAARCITCGAGNTCKTVCVGYDTCTIPAPSPDPSVIRMCMEEGKCASGGPFGVVGGAVIY